MPIAVVVLVSAQPVEVRSEDPFCSGNIQWSRTVGEVLAECVKVNDRYAGVPDVDEDAMDDMDRWVAGMWAAAAWTAGAVAEGPMSRKLIPLDQAGVLLESKLSLIWSEDGDLPTWAYASGVAAWLGWIVGGVDRVKYPGDL